jgi:hypothetical protein
LSFHRVCMLLIVVAYVHYLAFADVKFHSPAIGMGSESETSSHEGVKKKLFCSVKER